MNPTFNLNLSNRAIPTMIFILYLTVTCMKFSASTFAKEKVNVAIGENIQHIILKATGDRL